MISKALTLGALLLSSVAEATNV